MTRMESRKFNKYLFYKKMAKKIGRIRIAYYICIPLEKDFIESFSQRPVRLGVRTQDFHSCNTGSIPVRATDNTIQHERPVRLGVRTQDFHSCNTGSIPVRATNKKAAVFIKQSLFLLKIK